MDTAAADANYVVWSDIVATVPGGRKAAPRQVLTAARGYVRSGSDANDGLVALMGPSGSGKSTLLTLLIVPAGFSLADGFEKRVGPWMRRRLLTYNEGDDTRGIIGDGSPEPGVEPAE